MASSDKSREVKAAEKEDTDAWAANQLLSLLGFGKPELSAGAKDEGVGGASDAAKTQSQADGGKTVRDGVGSRKVKRQNFVTNDSPPPREVKKQKTETVGGRRVNRPSHNHSKESKAVLRGWFYRNLDNPYPSEDLKRFFAQQTGLNQAQIATFFTNERKRYPNPPWWDRSKVTAAQHLAKDRAGLGMSADSAAPGYGASTLLSSPSAMVGGQHAPSGVNGPASADPSSNTLGATGGAGGALPEDGSNSNGSSTAGGGHVFSGQEEGGKLPAEVSVWGGAGGALLFQGRQQTGNPKNGIAAVAGEINGITSNGHDAEDSKEGLGESQGEDGGEETGKGKRIKKKAKTHHTALDQAIAMQLTVERLGRGGRWEEEGSGPRSSGKPKPEKKKAGSSVGLQGGEESPRSLAGVAAMLRLKADLTATKPGLVEPHELPRLGADQAAKEQAAGAESTPVTPVMQTQPAVSAAAMAQSNRAAADHSTTSRLEAFSGGITAASVLGGGAQKPNGGGEGITSASVLTGGMLGGAAGAGKADECVTCNDGLRAWCIMPCGHKALCEKCATAYFESVPKPFTECPVCKGRMSIPYLNAFELAGGFRVVDS